MKKYILLTLCFVFYGSQFAQTEEKTVLLNVSGQGSSLENARQSALRTAIEQAFGTFISAKTEILNDEMVSDQITSVSAGNIQSFEILNEAQLPNGNWAVTLRVLVSVDKLTSFVQSKGVEVLIKGGLFTLNIKQQLLNEQGEIDAICEMVGVLHEPMQTAFDYLLKMGEPKSLDAESQNWAIPIDVSVIANSNLDVCMDYLYKTLKSIALTQTEVETYKSLGKNVHILVININGSDQILHFRKARSMEALLAFLNNWEFYVRNFTISDGEYSFNDYNTNYEKYANRVFFEFKRQQFESKGGYESRKQWDLNRLGFDGFDAVTDYNNDEKSIINYFIRIFTEKDTVVKFKFEDKKTLAELEKLERYTIKSNGIVSEFKFGGFVIFEDAGHGLVASLMDASPGFIELPSEDEQNAKFLDSIASNHKLNSFKDWRLPTLTEFDLITEKLVAANISVFKINTLGGGSYDKKYMLDSGSICLQYLNSLSRVNGQKTKASTLNIIKRGLINDAIGHVLSEDAEKNLKLCRSQFYFALPIGIRDYGSLRFVRSF